MVQIWTYSSTSIPWGAYNRSTITVSFFLLVHRYEGAIDLLMKACSARVSTGPDALDGSIHLPSPRELDQRG